MNETIRLLQHYHSDRNFTAQPIDDEILNEIVIAAHLAPSSFNSQQVSIVVVKDADKREKIARLAGDQPWIATAPVFIAVVLDLHKTDVAINLAGKEQALADTIEGVVSGCTDVGITLATLMNAARAYDLGVVAIGEIRRNPQAMIELLELPKYTYPVVGISMGYVEEPAYQKPRLALSTFRHNETYSSADLTESIKEYDEAIMQYWQHVNKADGVSWSESLAGAYSYNYFPEVFPTLQKQGFKFEK